MSRRTVTIPAAGVEEKVSMTGRSIIVEQAPAYPYPQAAPLISFNAPGYQFPAYTRSIFGGDGKKFNSISILGTAEAEGEVLHLFSSVLCLETQINTNAFVTKKALAGDTFNIAMDGSVKQISEVQVTDANGNLASSVYIAATGGNITYRWNTGTGTNPTVGGTDYLLVADAVPLEILGIDFVLNLAFIGAAASGIELVVTPRF